MSMVSIFITIILAAGIGLFIVSILCDRDRRENIRREAKKLSDETNQAQEFTDE